MIRVLQVIDTMDCGGAENMIMNLYRKIDRSKIQFDFLLHTKRDCFFNKEIISLGGKIYSVPSFNGFNFIEYYKAVENFFKNHKEYRVVHGHIASCATIYLSIAKKYGCSTIAHSHGTNKKNILFNIFSYPTRYVADTLFGCANKAGIARYGKRLWNKKNGVVLANGIDVEKFIPDSEKRAQLREELGLGNAFVIGHVGRFVTAKNHMYLLEIFKSVLDKKPDSKLLLLGDGVLKKQIVEKIKELNIENEVILTGVRSNVNEILQTMDCFLFPSLHEGLPVTVVEAQAAGLPCFLSDTITSEVCVTDLVKRIPIDVAPEVWSDEIVKCAKSSERNDVTDKVRNAGYDVSTTADWLTEFYLKKAE